MRPAVSLAMPLELLLSLSWLDGIVLIVTAVSFRLIVTVNDQHQTRHNTSAPLYNRQKRSRYWVPGCRAVVIYRLKDMEKITNHSVLHQQETYWLWKWAVLVRCFAFERPAFPWQYLVAPPAGWPGRLVIHSKNSLSTSTTSEGSFSGIYLSTSKLYVDHHICV